MGIIDAFRKKFYKSKARCENCGTIQEVNVPVGRTIDEYVDSDEATCKNCQCATLKRVIIVGKKAFYPAEKLDQIKQKVKEIDEAMSPSPLPRSLPKPKPMPRRNPHYEIEEVEVRRPLARDEYPTEDQYREPRPKRINFWTGDNEGSS